MEGEGNGDQTKRLTAVRQRTVGLFHRRGTHRSAVNNSNVSVTLRAQDDEGGSGVKEIRYSATGAQAISGTTVPGALATVNITTEGTTTISYFATDNAGNQESPAKTLTVKLDKSAPNVSGATPTGTEIRRGTNLTATFSEKMEPASINGTTFKLFKCPSTTSTNCTTQVTNITVSLSTDGLRATLNPYGTSSTLLAYRTRYKAVVTTEAKDVAGNAQKEWYFTTGRT
jgi:hypothetical protein